MTATSVEVLRESDSSLSAFGVVDKPGLLTVLFRGQPVVRFINEHAFCRNFRIEDLRLRPGGPIEMISMATSVIYPMTHLLACRWNCVIEGNHVTITLSPSKLEGDFEKLVSENRIYKIKYVPADDRFLYEITSNLHFHADIAGTEGLEHGVPLLQEGDDYSVIQVDNPMLSGGIGPQVPMTQDWVGAYEPVFSASGFTTEWKKRYVDVTIDTVKRGVRRIHFNRELNSQQKFYNRTLPVTKPRRPFIYSKIEGRAVRVTPLYDHFASHHICEWGFDQHFYVMLPRPRAGILFHAGQSLSLTYAMEEIEAGEVPLDYVNAKPAEAEPQEKAAADRPIYEEPTCRFADSALDHPDSYAWKIAGKCHWNRTGGHEPGYGSLEIRHAATPGDSPENSAWWFGNYGPSAACNPIPPISRYEFSAWIKADELDKVELSVEFAGFTGPGMWASRTDHPFNDAARTVVDRKGEWVKLAFKAGPTAAYTLYATLVFRYKGLGNAAMSGLRLHRL